MPFFPGQTGKLYMRDDTGGAPADGDEMAKVTNFTFNQTNAVIETTALGDTDRTIVQGVRSLTGSCRLFYYGYNEGGSQKNDCARLLSRIQQNSTYSKMEDKPDMGQSNKSKEVIFRLQVAANASKPKYLDIPAIITSVNMSVGTGEVMVADVTFEANGPALKGSTMNKEDW
jgi:hypothetical protein